MKIAYSHRPQSGVSVGATSNGSNLYIGFAFTSTKDQFSRSIARKIIEGRLKNGTTNSMTICIATNISARDFIKEFRKVFKPEYTDKKNEYFDKNRRVQNILDDLKGVALNICSQTEDGQKTLEYYAAKINNYEQN